MAPTTQLLRISELEASSQKHEVELAVLRESHERLAEDVADLSNEMKANHAAVAADMKDQNLAIQRINLTMAGWIGAGAIIVAVGAVVGAWWINTSLEQFKTAITHNNSRP